MDAEFARCGCVVEHLLRVPDGGRLLPQRVLGARDLHGGRRVRVLQQLAGNYTVPLGGRGSRCVRPCCCCSCREGEMHAGITND